MDGAIYANQFVSEGTATSAMTVTFPQRVGKVTITNDSGVNNLEFKFNESEDYATLQPTESVSLFIRTKTVYINGGNTPYRIWGLG